MVRLKVTYDDGVNGTNKGADGLPRVEWGGSMDGTPPLADQLAFVPDPREQRSGRVAQITVGPGHQFGTSTGERCLMTEDLSRRVEAPVPGDTRWYRWTYLLPPDWLTPSWAYMWEMHPGGNTIPQASPKVGFQGDALRLWVSGGQLTDGWRGTFLHDRAYAGGFRKGQWVDVLLGAHYRVGNQGWVTLKARPAGGSWQIIAHVNGPNLIHEPGKPPPGQYLEHGFYRNSSAFTNRLWLDDFAICDTEQEAVAVFPDPPPADSCADIRAELAAAVRDAETLRGKVADLEGRIDRARVELG